MSTRKTLEQQIEAKKTKIAQVENQLKELIQKQKEKDGKARTHRLCRRMGLLEKLVPDTITLTDKQFETLLKRTIANDFGRSKLAEIISQPEKPITAPQGETPKRNGEAAAPEVAKTSEGGGSVSAHGAEITEDKGS